MRAALLLILAGLAASAAPAAAQAPGGYIPGYVTEGEAAAAEAAARQRQVDLENRLNALEAARRADEAVRTLREQSARSTLSFAPPPGPRAVPEGLATIPDERLARSNQRVREAAANRR
ncbi:MAG: hypothetical protein ACK4YQ_15040 [Phenylobacterium sp.]|uniref:hypothetical protein n=1 Tax=Phenylobacterium sp. TaxID=1871053 RepID=UPI00391A2DDA